MNDTDENVDRRACTNSKCSVKVSCARAFDQDYSDGTTCFNNGSENGIACSAFILRKALGRDDPDMVFTEGRKRGRRHNAHAYTGPRTSYPGSEALFGAKLASALSGKRRAHNHQSKLDNTKTTSDQRSLRRPDLMVARHIREGRNIKEED